MKRVDSLLPRGDQTSGSQSFTDSEEGGFKKVKYVMKWKDMHETRFFSPPLTPRIAASPAAESDKWG